jgi:protein SCO1/2
MRKAGPFIVLFIILGLPLVIYFFLRTGTHVVQPLRIFSEKIANPGGGPDSVYKTINDFAFVGQSGDTVTLDSFKGSIWVANVFTTACPDHCPVMTQGIRDIQDYYRNFPDVRFLSISVDSANDSLPALREFANDFEAMENKWFFISGPDEKIHRFAYEEFGFGSALDDTTNAFKADFSLRLVDREGRMRGYAYDGSLRRDIDSVISHIVLLQREYEQQR